MILNGLIQKYGLLVIGGVLSIIFYCIFTLISWKLYPYEFWPTTHYLSRLGDYIYSPLGAYFYNAGCILTGIVLFPFFIGFSEWHEENIFKRYFMISGQVLGLFSAVALIMIGIFSEDQGPPHMTASTTFFLLNFFVLFIINFALLMNSRIPKPIPLYGLIFDIGYVALEFTIGGPIVEWITVFGSLLFVGMISLHTYYIRQMNEGTAMVLKDLLI